VEWTGDEGARLGAFNTGLFTPYFEPIIWLVTAHRDPSQRTWVFRDWVTSSDCRVRLVSLEALRPAYYFDDPADLLYGPRLVSSQTWTTSSTTAISGGGAVVDGIGGASPRSS
jgi:hypothetical protein